MASSAPLERIKPLSIGVGILKLCTSVILIVGGILVFSTLLPKHTNLVSLQWAQSASAMNTLIGRGVHAYGNYRVGLYLDLCLIATYSAGLALACSLGRRVFWTPVLYTWAGIGLVATGLAAGFNVVQDILLLVGVNSRRGTWIFRFAASLSFLKFAALLVAAAMGVLALTTAVGRLATHCSTRRNWTMAALEATGRDACNPLVIPPAPVELGPERKGRPFFLDRTIDRAWWSAKPRQGAPTHFVQDGSIPDPAPGEQTGICVSGGGIRSASVTLGALQALRADRPQDFGPENHLVSVSGGGYMTGGFQLALAPPIPPQTGTGGAQASDVFEPGSPEEDHLRRHSSYLSDGFGQWVIALGVLFRNLLAALLVIGLTVVAVGMGVGRFYRTVPIVGGGLGTLPTKLLSHAGATPPSYPPIPWAVTLGLAFVATLGALVYIVQLIEKGVTGRRNPALAQLGAMAAITTVFVGTIGVALPALVWVSSWVTWHLGFTGKPVVTAGGVSVALSYLGVLTTTLWRNKLVVEKIPGDISSAQKEVSGVLPNSMIQMLIMWIILLVLVLAALLAAGWVATSGLDDSWWALSVVGPLALFWFFLDQTAMSLHPFYRRRLASAFAVRRASAGGVSVAMPYEDSEETPLSTYGATRTGFPHVTFAASANLTGQDRTPPGRRSVSYAFGSTYVGGPQVGWVRTDYLEAIVSNALAHDLTVESAIAVSGAAFASAMGAQTRFYELFLALTNARLGAWLPNPYFVALKHAHAEDWTVPGLPHIRRLTYFAREIFGIHPSTSRLLLCTDGGHYDNLGLVELLRRGCTSVYCFDASGSSRPLADTLSGAMTLAREELGIKIVFWKPYDLVVGGATPLNPVGPLAALNSQLASNPVIVGEIHYPETTGGTKPPGVLIFAQTDLAGDMPYEILEFRQDDPGFPNDGTADQWFDASRFDSYQQLGYYLGHQAAGAALAIEELPTTS